MQVEIKTLDKWYPAKIQAIPSQSSPGYTVTYTDSTVEEGVVAERIRALGQGELVGGVFFLDEAYDLDVANSSEGRAIMAELMVIAEDQRDKVTIIIAGYKEDIESKIYAHNIGMASRFQTIHFEDFSQIELGEIWKSYCVKSDWACEQSVSDVVSRRIARSKGIKGFGNARTVRSRFDEAVGFAKDRFFMGVDLRPTLVVEDIVGREPNRKNNPQLDAILTELDSMTGQAEVKDAFYSLVHLAESNYHKELRGERIDDFQMNRVFLGNPGTGKTTTAKLYGRLLKCLRYLTNGEVVYKTASDFLGDIVGASTQKTKAILEACQGKVLVIDESYVLNDNLYGKNALDTIVEKVSGAPGENICVVLCGYEPQMMAMLRDQNPGLARRFDLSYAFRFHDFLDEELLAIFYKAAVEKQIRLPLTTSHYAVKKLILRRALPNFGNAGAVNSLLADGIRRMFNRILKNNLSRERADLLLLPGDFDDLDFEKRRLDPLKAFDDLSDVGEFKSRLAGLGKQAQVLKQFGKSTAGLLTNYVFTGSPGTGKTTVASKISSVLFSYGLLATDHVELTSAQDLQAQYVGQTAKNVETMMQKAKGGVLSSMKLMT